MRKNNKDRRDLQSEGGAICGLEFLGVREAASPLPRLVASDVPATAVLAKGEKALWLFILFFSILHAHHSYAILASFRSSNSPLNIVCVLPGSREAGAGLAVDQRVNGLCIIH